MTPQSLSSAERQEKLWERVLSRRIKQLSRFSVEQLRDLSGDKSGSSRDALQKYVGGLLEAYFSDSINSDLKASERAKSLSKLKALLEALDDHLSRAAIATHSRKNNKKKRKDQTTTATTNGNTVEEENGASSSTSKLGAKSKGSTTVTSNSTTTTSTSTITKSVEKASMGSRLSKTSTEGPSNIEKSKLSTTVTSTTTTSTRSRTKSIEKEIIRSRLSKLSTEGPSNKNAPQSIPVISLPPEKPLPPLQGTLYISADNPINPTASITMSASLKPRGRCDVTCNMNDFVLFTNLKRDFDNRLRTWEPFWNVVHDFSTTGENKTQGLKTSRVLKVDNLSQGEKPKSCAAARFIIPYNLISEKGGDERIPEWGVSKIHNKYRDGERRLMLRMLPIPKSAKCNYKADTHIFPKGSFIQVNKKPLSYVMQRKQQSHDEKLWKGNCYSLDLTPSLPFPNRRQEIEMVNMEEAVYGLQIALCEYRSPDHLIRDILNTIEEIPYEKSSDKARSYLNRQIVTIDDSDEDDVQEPTNDGVSLMLKLICLTSMKPIRTPVRGRNCNHMQCFDLETFVETNSFPCARRWRCACCEEFVSVSELVVCGLFRKMLDKYKNDISQERNEVEFKGDGTWTLFKERAKKKNSTSDEAEEESSRAKRKKPPPEEIILL